MVTRRSLFWTGPLNDEARAGSPPLGPVGFYDTTLRDGEQVVGLVLAPEKKLEIARALDELGVGRIEAGFPLISDEDREAVRLVSEAGLQAEVWGFARALPTDVEPLIELGVRSTVIESPTSDVKLEAFGLARDALLSRVESAVSFAATRGLTVCFFAVDGSRSDPRFLETVYKTALEAGATEVAAVDTLGVLTPEAVELFVRRVREWVGPSVPIHFHGHNDFGLATAAALAAAGAGARWIHVTMNGMGERAGNADLCQVAIALEGLYGVPTGIRFERLRDASNLVSRLSSYSLEPWRPVIGENLFTRETSLAARYFHLPGSMEPFSAELVRADRRIVLGKRSGLDSIRFKCAELALELSEERFPEALAAVKQLSIEKREKVGDAEFRQIVKNLTAAR